MDGRSAASVHGETALLLQELAGRGIRLWLEDGRLLCSVPAEAMDEALRARLRAGRSTLMALLAREAEPGDANAPEAGVARLPPGAARPLTFAQEALLPLARARRGEGVYNVPLAIEIEGAVDQSALSAAMVALQTRHEALRTCFPAAASGPQLRPWGAWIGVEASVPLPGIGADDPGGDAAVETAFREAVARPFDIEGGPLWRMAVASGPDRTLLLWVFHHLVFDGFSRDVFLADLGVCYAAARARTKLDKPPPAFQPTDFAAWERRRAGAVAEGTALDWWRAQFTDPHPAAALPPAAPMSPEADSLRVTLPAATAAALRARAASARLSPAALALAGVALALHRITGQRRVLVCTPLSNRDRPEAEGIVGYLNRLLPLSVDVGGAGSGADLAAAVGRDLFAADAHRHLPSGDIVGLPGLARTRIDRLMVGWQERGAARPFGPHPARHRSVARAGADFGLALQFEAEGERLDCRIDRAADVLGTDGAAEFGRLLCEMLDALVGVGWTSAPAQGAEWRPEALASRVAEHPGVSEAEAVADAETGAVTLFLVLDEFERISAEALRPWLAERGGGLLPPLRFVTLPALPRTAAGGIDRQALSERLRASAHASAAAPRTPLERTIAEIWCRVLWLDRPVGIDEAFRDLGGHSLLSVRMLADLQAALGRPLPLRTLLRLGTVADLAAAVEEAETALQAQAQARPDQGIDPAILDRIRVYTASWAGRRPFAEALMVGLNGNGWRIPLFWCLQNETEFGQLARYLGDDQPVYGMRSGHEVMVKSRENITRLAARYAEEIQIVQPHGPLFLGGNCQAAVIAFETARHLEAAGRIVAQLILHEKMIAEPRAGRVALSFGRESDRNPYLASDDPLSEFRTFYTGTVSLDIVSGGHGAFFREPHVLDLVAMIRRRRDETPELASGHEGDQP